jgi:dTDP-4-amino-4,6-dideoxygalactose transaminase
VRNNIAAAYNDAFADLPEIQTPFCEPDLQHAWHLYVIQLQREHLKITRDQFIQALKERGIGTSVHFIPLHLHPYYRDSFGYVPGDFPNATEAYQRIISLPIYPKMREADVDYVIDAVKKLIEDSHL